MVALVALVGLTSPGAARAQDAGPGGPPPAGEAGFALPPGLDPLDDIVIRPWEDDRIQVAVPEVRNVGETRDGVGLDRAVTELLRRDLHISGFFEVLPSATFGIIDAQRDGMTASNLDFDGWYAVGAGVVIKGTYQMSEGGSALLDLRVFDVMGRGQVPIDWQPTRVTSGDYRRAVHSFVNALIAYYTGTPGPFGSRMVFVAPGPDGTRRLMSVEMDGEGMAIYEDAPRALNVLPSWGPQGQILFTSFSDEGTSVLSHDPGEKTTRVLTRFEGINAGADYCASRDLVALTLSRDGNPEIYTMRPDGTELTRLTDNTFNDTTPTWGPGCSKLAFVSDREGTPQIYTMRLDGTDARRLTFVGNYNTTPEWSPTGEWIAFTARDERRQFDVFVVRADGSEIYRITQDQGDNEEPSWSPDGRYLVFQSTRDGREPRLYLARVDEQTWGRFQTRITNGIGYRTPTWQR